MNMKKGLWMLGLAAVAMTSCTQNEVLEVAENRAIGFEDVFVGKATRAANPTENSLNVLQQSGKGFYVYGGYETVTDVFDNTHVTYNESSTTTSKWEYTPIRYWVKDKYYKFVAYAPAMNVTPTFLYGTASTPSTNDATLTFTGVTIDGTTDNQKDFIVAKSGVITPTVGYTDKVKFTFYHALSMIKVTLRNGFADGVQVTIGNFQIEGIKTQGDFVTKSNDVFSAGDCGTWSNWNEGEAQGSSTFTDAGTTLNKLWSTATSDDIDALKAYSNEFIVIPQTIGTVKVKFNVTVTDAHGDKIVDNKSFNVAVPTNSNSAWAINNRYHYTLTIDGKSVDLTPIEFDEPSVEAWGTYGTEEGLVTQGS